MLWNAMKWILLFASVAAVCSASPAYGGAGTSAGDFVNIPTFSRGSALAGSCIAVAEGTGALFYNPAGIARNGSGELSLSHSELYQDLRLDNLSLAYPLSARSAVGVGITYLGYGTIKGFDVEGNSTGNIDAYSLLVALGFSRQLSDNVWTGVAVKPVFERLAAYSARTVTFDLGLLAEVGQFCFGAQLANFGGSLKYVREEIELPTSYRIGVAYRTLGGSSTLSFSGSRQNEGDYVIGSGIEYLYSSNLSFRVGYESTLGETQHASNGLSLGVGFQIMPLCLDYSYRPSNRLGGEHFVTGSYRLGK